MRAESHLLMSGLLAYGMCEFYLYGCHGYYFPVTAFSVHPPSLSELRLKTLLSWHLTSSLPTTDTHESLNEWTMSLGKKLRGG